MRAILLSIQFFTIACWLSCPAIGYGQQAAPAVGVQPDQIPPAEEAEEVVEDADMTAIDRQEEAIEQRIADFAALKIDRHDPQFMVLWSYIRVNTAFARRVCQLTAAQEQQLELMDPAWLATQIRDAGESPLKNAAAGIARFLRGQPQPIAQPRPDQQQITMQRVKQAVDSHIEQTLTDAQRGEFRTQYDARKKFRTESLARVLVAALDARLYLSADQRQQLEREVAQWLKKDLFWQFYFQNQNYIPDIPRSVLTQVLTIEQVSSLQGANAWMYELAQAELHMHELPVLIER